MAIKEFIIGPQNYFEDGYFSGDYTEPNVSRSFLECDVDKVRGGRVITGEYYLGEYIDGSYYHNNTSKFELSADAMIVQDATIRLAGYFEEGYYASGYTESRGSQFTLTAELERAGMVVEAEGSWSSTASITAAIGKIVEVASAIAAEFTTSAIGSRSKDIDLFAFSEAAIATTVDRIRDNNISASAAFSIATDGRVYRDVASEEVALFSISANIIRSRAFTIETQAAFSLTATVREVVTITPATFTVTASSSVSAKRTARITRTLSTAVSLTAVQYPTPQDSDYPITNRALMHMDSDPFVDVYTGTLTNATAGTLVSGKFGNAIGYPVSGVASITNSSGIFNNLFTQSAWSVDFWWKPRDLTTGSNVYPTVGILALSNGATGGPYDSDIVIGWEQTTLVSSGSASGKIYLGYWWSKFAETSQTSYTYNATTKDANEWKHIAVTFQNLGDGIGNDNLRIGLFVNGVGSFTNVSSVGQYSGATTSMYLFPTLSPVTDRDSLGSYSRSFQGYIDEFRFQPGVAYTGNFTPPTVAYSPSPYYSAGAAYLSVDSSLSATPIFVVDLLASLVAGSFTQTATAQRTRKTASSLTIAFTQTASVGRRVSAGATLSAAFTTSSSGQSVKATGATLSAAFTQTAVNRRVRYNASDINSLASVNATVVKKTSTTSSISVSASQSLVNGRIRYANTAFESIATELTAAFKNATGTVTLESAFTSTVIAQKITDKPQMLDSEFTVNDIDFTRFRDTLVTLDTVTDIHIDGLRLQPAGGELTSTATMTVSIDKVTGYAADLSDAFTQTVVNARTRDLDIDLNTDFAIVSDNDVLRLAQANLLVDAEIIASPTFIVRITANFTAFNTQLTLGDVINIDPFLQIRVRQETRVGTVLPELRAITVDQESRVNIIQG